ncbi:DUF7563 family protein [Natrinema thermotolerans]
MPECDGCGAHVTPDYHRVFSTPDGDLPVCINCTSNREAREAAKDNQ